MDVYHIQPVVMQNKKQRYCIDTGVDLTADVNGDATVLFYAARGMTATDPVRDTITVSPFLTTSESGVAVVDENNQTPGTYAVGILATEAIDDGITARLTVFGSSAPADESLIAQFPSLENLSLFVSAVTVGFDDVGGLDIAPVSLCVFYYVMQQRCTDRGRP